MAQGSGCARGGKSDECRVCRNRCFEGSARVAPERKALASRTGANFGGIKMCADLFMTSLPGKSLARAVSTVAIAGCALSLSVHVLALIGVYSKSILNFEIGLFTGVFPVFLLAVLAQERLLTKFTFQDRMIRMLDPKFGHKVVSRLLLGQSPKWLRTVFIALFVNALAQFAIFAYQTFPSGTASQSTELRILSAYAAAFYSAAATILASYARTERVLGPDEL
jgi:hypothetical protein